MLIAGGGGGFPAGRGKASSSVPGGNRSTRGQHRRHHPPHPNHPTCTTLKHFSEVATIPARQSLSPASAPCVGPPWLRVRASEQHRARSASGSALKSRSWPSLNYRRVIQRILNKLQNCLEKLSGILLLLRLESP